MFWHCLVTILMLKVTRDVLTLPRDAFNAQSDTWCFDTAWWRFQCSKWHVMFWHCPRVDFNAQSDTWAPFCLSWLHLFSDKFWPLGSIFGGLLWNDRRQITLSSWQDVKIQTPTNPPLNVAIKPDRYPLLSFFLSFFLSPPSQFMWFSAAESHRLENNSLTSGAGALFYCYLLQNVSLPVFCVFFASSITFFEMGTLKR